MNLRKTGRSILDRYTSSLQYPDFRRMWLATVLSGAAATGLVVARGWLIFEMTDSLSMVGTITFLAMIPSLLTGPIIGVIADRIDRRSLLAWSYGLNLGHNVILVSLALSSLLEPWHLMALSLTNGVVQAGKMPVSNSLMATLVPRDKLLNAMSLNSATQRSSQLLGPGLVTPLLGLLGAPAAFIMTTALYAVGWLMITRIQTRSGRGIKKGEAFVTSLIEGLRYTFSHPILRTLIIMVFFHCGLTMGFQTLLPGLSFQRLNAGAAGYGILMMGIGAGGTVSSFLIGGIQSTMTRGRLYLLTGVFSGLSLAMLALAPTIELAVVVATVVGAIEAAFMTLTRATTQSLALDKYRGRLAGVDAISVHGAMAFMSLINGFLGDAFGIVAVMLVESFIFTGIVLSGFALITSRTIYLKGLPTEEAREPAAEAR